MMRLILSQGFLLDPLPLAHLYQDLALLVRFPRRFPTEAHFQLLATLLADL